MESLLNLSLNEIEEKFEKFGTEKYRAKQVYTALLQGKTFDEMNINKSFKETLKANFISQPMSILKSMKSVDSTVKFLFLCQDKNIVEGVLMNYKFGTTLCISSQVGCAMGCKFCASTLDGLVRNLSSDEIFAQVILANKFLNGGLTKKRKITNIVLMGSGEPLSNYDNVLKFLDLVCSKNTFNFSERNISISTCGIAPKIIELANSNHKVSLTLSLHAPTDEIRQKIMKVANLYSIKEVLSACKYYMEKTKRRIMFEYILIKDVNDSLTHARKLANLVKDFNAHVNLIPLNEIKESPLKTITKKQAYAFMNELEKQNINVTLRRTLGQDISASCGQLRKSFLNENNEN